MERDFIGKIQDAQCALADRIGEQLRDFNDAPLQIAKAHPDKWDADAVQLRLVSDLQHEAHRCVDGYTDYVASTIIRSRRFKARRLEIPEGALAEDIARKYDTKVSYLRVVALLMREEAQLPLLGKVKNGVLTPDRKTLKKWASYYDWTKRSETAPA